MGNDLRLCGFPIRRSSRRGAEARGRIRPGHGVSRVIAMIDAFGGGIRCLLDVVRKGGWEDGEASPGSGSGSGSVSKGRGLGYGHEDSGSTTELLRCRHNLAAKYERYSEGKVPVRPGIDFDPDPDSDLSVLQSLPEGARLFGRTQGRRRWGGRWWSVARSHRFGGRNFGNLFPRLDSAGCSR